jgi:hypothetical protein
MSNVPANSFLRTHPRLSGTSWDALDSMFSKKLRSHANSPLYEVYRDAAAFDAHLRSRHFESFSEATRDIFVSQSVRQFDLRNEGAAPRATASRNTRGYRHGEHDMGH